MALILEDGTGVANANSYVSQADVNAYVTQYIPASDAVWTLIATGDKDNWIIQGTEIVELTYRARFRGSKGTKAQALYFPAVGVTLASSGYALDSDVVPTDLTDAVAYASVRLSEGKIFFGDKDDSSTIKREKLKAGSVEIDTEYANTANGVQVFPKIETLLSDLLKAGSSQVSIMRA